MRQVLVRDIKAGDVLYWPVNSLYLVVQDPAPRGNDVYTLPIVWLGVDIAAVTEWPLKYTARGCVLLEILDT